MKWTYSTSFTKIRLENSSYNCSEPDSRSSAVAPSSTSHQHQNHHQHHHHQLHHHQLIADAAGNVRPVASSAEDVSRQQGCNSIDI